MRGSEPMRGLLLIALAGLAAGCATLKNDRTVCPEYRELRCVAGADCSMDETRGCKVCQCASVETNDRQGRIPDRRNPDPYAPR